MSLWNVIKQCLGNIYTDNSSFVVSHVRNPFEVLVSVILSQNTTDRNAIRALKNLKNAIGKITPESILNTRRDDIIKCIRPSGMYKGKAETIVRAARAFSEIGGEDAFLRMSPKRAKSFLTGIKGIGVKTAEVVLMITHRADVFPVDTHIRRITLRLGVVRKANYEEISNFWKSIIPKDLYYTYHKKLIEFGRSICKARRPSCGNCCLKEICMYYKNKKYNENK